MPRPKYLIQASYTAEGLRGLQKDKASGRRQAVLNALEPLRGKLESFNYAFGGDDVVAVIDMPNVNAAAMSLAIAALGLIRLKTTPLPRLGGRLVWFRPQPPTRWNRGQMRIAASSSWR